MSLKRLAALFLVLVLLLPPALLHAGEDEEELERLREAVEKGQVLPLSTLRTMLLKEFPGEIVKIELDIEDGEFSYEFKVLQSDGRLIEVELDAASGQVIDIEDDD